MKEAFIYKNDVIIAADLIGDEGFEVYYEYQDNIEEIMKEENILEFLEESKAKIKNNIREIEKKLEINNRLMFQYLYIGVIFGLFFVIFGILFGIFSDIWITAWALPLLVEITCSIFAVYTKINSRLLTKKLNGYKVELKEVEDKIKENKEYLEIVKKDKTVSDIKKEKIKKDVNYVRYKEQLNELKTYLEIYRKIGRNIEVYRKYYKNGVLDEKLETKYNDSQIKLIKKYLNDENKFLVN